MFFTLNRFLMVYFVTDNNGYVVLGKHQFNSVSQSCLTLGNPMDYGLPGFSVHGIFQARIPKWVAVSFARGSSRSRDRTHVS